MVLISKCLGSTSCASEFRFTGYFRGQNIDKIVVEGGEFIKGEDYLIRINFGHILKGTLHATTVKSKLLEDL